MRPLSSLTSVPLLQPKGSCECILPLLVLLHFPLGTWSFRTQKPILLVGEESPWAHNPGLWWSQVQSKLAPPVHSQPGPFVLCPETSLGTSLLHLSCSEFPCSARVTSCPNSPGTQGVPEIWDTQYENQKSHPGPTLCVWENNAFWEKNAIIVKVLCIIYWPEFPVRSHSLE